MKLTKVLPLLPTIALLASCAQTEIKLSQDKDAMVAESQTAAPNNFVVYPDDRPSIVDGEALYKKPIFDKQNCASCHGASGETVQGGFALNDKRAMSQKKPVDLFKVLCYGKSGSKHAELALKDKLTNKEIWNLVFYSKALGTPPLTTAEIDVIQPVFGSNCAVCHGTKGDGDGPLARNLEPNPANFQTMRRFFDREDDILYDHIANGIKFEGMPNFLGKEDRKKNFKFDQENIRKLVQYVRTFTVNGEGYKLAQAGGPGAASAATPATAAPATAAPTAAPAAPAEGAAHKPEENGAAKTPTEADKAPAAGGENKAPAAETKEAPKAETKPATEKTGAPAAESKGEPAKK